MPRHDFPRFRRQGWMREDKPKDESSDGNPHPAGWPVGPHGVRPPWWPENELWPPRRRHWMKGVHRPFFRRLGCIFLLLNWFGIAILVSVVFLVLNSLGVTSVAAPQLRWIAPIAGVLLAVTVSVMILAGTSVRRMSRPLDELLTASERVAEGDYSVRVAARGPMAVRSLAAAFNSMTEKLETHDRQRRSMLADVSHELRTPLTIIQGNLEGVLDGLYPADEARLRSLLEETQILSRLTDDLRTLALAESGSLELRRESTDLIALTQDVIAAFRSQADSGHVRLELSALRQDITLSVDAERIRQVLGNLISNAVRYSPAGEAVQVTLSVDDKNAVVSVADSGPGIAAADLPHIFDRYYKSADSRGMGLGLSIAKYIVEAHGGQIWAESHAGQGTVISFTLTV